MHECQYIIPYLDSLELQHGSLSYFKVPCIAKSLAIRSFSHIRILLGFGFTISSRTAYLLTELKTFPHCLRSYARHSQQSRTRHAKNCCSIRG